MEVVVIAIALLQFHGPTGQRIDVNPQEVTSVREPQKGSSLLDKSVRCLIGMSNGKFISLSDDCASVRLELQGRGDAGPCALVCGDARR